MRGPGEAGPGGTLKGALLTPDEALVVLAQQQSAQVPSLEREILTRSYQERSREARSGYGTTAPGAARSRRGPAYFFIPLVIGPLNSLTWSRTLPKRLHLPC